MNSSMQKGIVLVAIASFLYGLQGILFRLVGSSLGTFYPFVVRGFIIATILLIFLYFTKGFKKIKTKDYKWFILMPFSGIISFITVFIAYNNLTIGTVLFIFYAVFAISGFLFGYLFFKEKLNTIKIVSLAISLLGLSLVFSGSYLGENFLYLLFSAVSGVATSLWYIASKKISSNYSNSQILAVDSLFVFVICFIISILLREKLFFPSFSIPWLSVFGMTAVSLGAFVTVVYGYRFLSAQIASLLLLTEVIFGIILAWIFFSEIPTSLAFLGGIVILIGVALPNIPSIRKIQ